MSSPDDLSGAGDLSSTGAADLEAMYALAVAASEFHPDGLVTVDKDGLIDFVNTRAVKITGIPGERLRHARLVEALPFQDMTGRSWWDYVDPWNSLGIVTGHREQTLILPNGCVMLVTARYMRNPDNSILAILLSLRDAAGRLRAERAMGDVLTTVAHELRSPVAGITGFTSSLLQHWDRVGDEDKQTMLRLIQDDAQRLTRLIAELLDISRIDAHTLKIHPRPVDLEEVLRSQVSRQVASGVPEERFEVRVDPGLPEFWADPDRLEQVVTNLVTNAVEHGAGTVCLWVRPVELGGGEPGVRLCVCDEGDGIPEENRELVFSRKWQGGAKAGTGLGLYLVRGIVEAHGGTVSIGEQEGGFGTVVEVILPAGGLPARTPWAMSTD